ncbi:MAG: rhomboid family intramembrane serine protease [Pseudomonadota bacterium]
MIECALMLADLDLLRPARLRLLSYENAGFWPGLLEDWQPNYPAQPYLMFLTYSFLHTGPVHLVINMITLWSLGRAVIARAGLLGLTLLYAMSILGGAVGYAALASGLQPMVGASGALFGLAGGLLAWMYVDRFTYRLGLLPVAQAVVLLIVLNLVLWWAMDGQLAWETHLGGFIAGWIMAFIIDPRPLSSRET